jgi:hypothetical protein
MGWLSTKRPASPRPAIRDPLAVVPLKPDNVEMRRDSQGLIHLRLRPELAGLRKRIADSLGHDYTRKVALDEIGTQFYSLVDGKRALNAIIHKMARESGRDQKEVTESVVLFTKKLMTMNLIVLKVDGENGDAHP